MKVFLGNPPWSKTGFYGVRAGSRWPHFEAEHHEYMPFPFFLAYATAVLEARGTEVLLVDAIAEGIDDQAFWSRVRDFEPDLALLEVSTPSLETDEVHWKAVRGLLDPGARLALCGLHQPMREPGWLAAHPEVDLVFFGEYELTLREVVERLERGASLEGIDGLVYREDGVPRTTGAHSLILDLDALPWPARHFLPMYNYRDEPGSIPRPSVQMWASRGCPYRCSFCAWPQIMYGGFKYRTRSIIDVIDETESIVRDWSFRSVYYDDDTFNLGKKRMLEFSAEYKRRGIGVPWAVMARVDGMDEEILEAMADAGLHALKYGIESADQSIVDRCGKRLDLSRVRQVVHATHALGIKTHLTFVFGLPGETVESARKTIDLALELSPESLQFTLATPFPGSTLYRELEAEGKLRATGFSHFDGFHTAVVSTDTLTSSDLEDILAEANKRWREQRLARRSFTARVAQADAALETGPVTGGERRLLATVIIPNYNGMSVLHDCLMAVRRQTYQPMQVVVVDDASADQSAVIVERAFEGVELVQRERNGGFAAAVNSGLTLARGAFIAILNNDTRPEPGWLEASVRALRELPEVGMVTGKILTFDAPPRIYSVGIGVTRSGYTFNIGQGTPEVGQFNEPRFVLGASGAASVWRREVFEIVGGFDEDIGHYLEDVDLSLRAQLEGIRCYYDPGAVVQHWGGVAGGGQNAAFQVRQVSRNIIGVLLKDVPRVILQRHAARVSGGLALLLTHHALLGRGGASLSGFFDGLMLGSQMVAKRKRVLGHQKVPDEQILSLLQQSEQYLRETAAHLPRLQRARLRLMGMA